MKETDEQYKDRAYLLRLIFELQQREKLASDAVLELSSKICTDCVKSLKIIHSLTKQLEQAERTVKIRREESKRYKADNKNLRKSLGFYIDKEKDSQGFC